MALSLGKLTQWAACPPNSPGGRGLSLSGKDSRMSTTTWEPIPTTIQVLRQSPILALRRLSLEETDAALIIRGNVSSYYLKQMAQETLRPLLAGRQLVNQVRVVEELVPSY